MDMDDDFKLALKLSMELNGHGSVLSHDNILSLPTTSSNLNEHRKRPGDVDDYIQPFKKFTFANEGEDYQLALKLSEEINNQPSTSKSNQHESLSTLKSSKENSTSGEIKFNDRENDDFFLALKLPDEGLNPDVTAVRAVTPMCSNSIELSKLTSDKKEKKDSDETVSVEDFSWDDPDEDFLLAIKLSQEDFCPGSKAENSFSSVASSSRNLLKSTSGSDGKSHSDATTSIDDYGWDNDGDEDFLLAVKLSQEDFDPKSIVGLNNSRSTKPVNGNNVKNYSDQSISVVDPSWELIDPNPDIYALFAAFNKRFFWGKLESVEVKWSPRMTLCAGVCSYSPRAGFCSVRLSKPLLQLRPRKDLVETLLHEMIHAFLFVTKNDRDRDGHGPRFHSHMYRINKESGANITVYHSFHAEVKAYKTHWWRCDGPCQHKQPFYGYVKRSTNRAPGPNDLWWNNHRAECGGNFIKIKEPEGYQNKKLKKGNGSKPKVNGLNNYFTPRTSTTSASATNSSSFALPNRALDVGISNSSITSGFVNPSSTTNSQNRAKNILNMVNSNAKIHTINTISSGKNSNQSTKSPQESHWVPLPAQKNIFHFINKS